MALPDVDQLTHSQENILDLHWLESSEAHPDELEVVARSMATHLRHLLDKQDVHLEVHAQFNHLVLSRFSNSLLQSADVSKSLDGSQCVDGWIN